MRPEPITKSGNHPEALVYLAEALAFHVEDPYLVAAKVFGVLHDAGLRIVAREHVAR